MKGWKVGSLAAVAFALFCGWYVASPWVTLYGIQAAAERRDTESMIAYVDFDALRANLKDQVRTVMANRPKPKSTLPAGWSMPDRADTELDAIQQQIDIYVTPDTARALLGKAGPVTPRAMGGIGDVGKMARDIVIDRETLGQFVVRGKRDGTGLGLVFTAHGLGWRLSGIRLPPAATQNGVRGMFGFSGL